MQLILISMVSHTESFCHRDISYHLEGMVNEDDIDLLQRSSDIHGIPRLDESQHFDGHPRAV